jgi:hypothetical protein
MNSTTADDLAEISARWPEIAQCFQSQKAYQVARGTSKRAPVSSTLLYPKPAPGKRTDLLTCSETEQVTKSTLAHARLIVNEAPDLVDQAQAFTHHPVHRPEPQR